MLYAPAQIDCHVVVGIDLIHRQALFLNGFQVPCGIVHIAGEFFLCKRSSGDGILAGGIDHKTDACHLFKQGVRIMLHLILHLIMIERDHLIEVDLLAARQSADFTSVPDNILRTYQKCGAEFRILCKRRLLIHCVAKAQPGIVGNRQACQHFQETNRPVPPLILQGFLIQFPIRWQSDGQLCSFQLVFRQFLRHIHPVSTHAHRYQCVIVPLIRGRNNADVHMDVRGNQLMEHILKLTKGVFDVLLYRRHLILRINLRLAVFS